MAHKVFGYQTVCLIHDGSFGWMSLTVTILYIVDYYFTILKDQFSHTQTKAQKKDTEHSIILYYKIHEHNCK